jgi:hypothetical protein
VVVAKDSFVPFLVYLKLVPAAIPSFAAIDHFEMGQSPTAEDSQDQKK